jgi:hypothetical protein
MMEANVFQHPDAIAAVQIRRDDGVQRIDDAPMPHGESCSRRWNAR